VTWVGCGPMSNLAAVLTIAPYLSEQIAVTQMGGWLSPERYRDPRRATTSTVTGSLRAWHCA
jgi:inosine-uridine nucleoside N-ribohydrolase